jgi:hypothetical protein
VEGGCGGGFLLGIRGCCLLYCGFCDSWSLACVVFIRESLSWSLSRSFCSSPGMDTMVLWSEHTAISKLEIVRDLSLQAGSLVQSQCHGFLREEGGQHGIRWVARSKVGSAEQGG